MIQNTFQRLIVKFLKNVGVLNSGNGASRRDDKEAFICKRGGRRGNEWKVDAFGKARHVLTVVTRDPGGTFHIRTLETPQYRPLNYLTKAPR